MKLRVVALLLAAACSVEAEPTVAPAPVASENVPPLVDPTDAATASILYPDARALFYGPQGLHRSCSANEGVCHNDKEYPDLSSLGALELTIRAPCNVNREGPRVHDLCEGEGDYLQVGPRRVELGSLRSMLPKGERVYFGKPHPVEAFLREPVRPRAKVLDVQRKTATGFSTLGQVVRRGAKRESHRLQARLPSFRDMKRYKIPRNRYYAERRRLALALDGTRPGDVRFGDPNRNGIFGADLGGALVVPGDPEKSYLLRRMVDPTAGPLMPRANCCAWTKAALRATHCWIAGLTPSGSNARDPIDYANCPPGPVEDVAYPTPGPGCEVGGMCPVAPRISADSEATWPVVYEILSTHCGDDQCHGGDDGTELDVLTPNTARASLDALIVPGDAAQSELYRRLSPKHCPEDRCTLMPMAADPLPVATRRLVHDWIQAGAPMPEGFAGEP